MLLLTVQIWLQLAGEGGKPAWCSAARDDIKLIQYNLHLHILMSHFICAAAALAHVRVASTHPRILVGSGFMVCWLPWEILSAYQDKVLRRCRRRFRLAKVTFNEAFKLRLELASSVDILHKDLQTPPPGRLVSLNFACRAIRWKLNCLS